uniref:Uncharacterized protein n=1 Tax=Candidatus Kentrum sp. LFY TaxID=2126342 RepID=A0A450X795_9GAMM|nr:MAG: hypothetical protein BECKLFY1418C_GA0070996_12211 [Candidatus Kentron sp. LFY]
MRGHIIKVVLIGMALSVGGCSLIKGPEYSYLGGTRVNETGAAQILPGEFEYFNLVDLAKLLEKDPEGKESTEPQDAARNDNNGKKRLANALRDFGNNYIDPKKGQQRRNEIQDRLIAASEQRCNVYKIGYSSNRVGNVILITK